MNDTADLKVYAARVPEYGAPQAAEIRKVRDALLLYCYCESRPGAQLPEAATKPHGKPYFPEDPSFRFSISHSGTHVAIAFARDSSHTLSIGLDIQELRRIPESCLNIAKRFFTQEEYEVLAAAPDEERRTLFNRVWAAKEAFLKMTGEGLQGGTDSFSVLSGKAITDRITRAQTVGFLCEPALFSTECSAAVCCNVPVKSLQSVLVPEEVLFPEEQGTGAAGSGHSDRS